MSSNVPLPLRVTLRDLAKTLGLSHAAVSMALRDHPQIAAKTRQRVKEEAARCGYRPEPMLSALAAYRQTKKPSVYHGTLAWLFDHPAGRELFARTPLFKLYAEGARWRASLLGFQIEDFCLDPRDMLPERLSDILLARGVQGILVSPQTSANSQLAMRWEWFSAVTFGFSLVQPQLHLISSTQYRIGMMATRKLQELGYQRIGMFTGAAFDLRTDSNFTAGFHIASLPVAKSCRVPLLKVLDNEPPDKVGQKIRQWIKRWRVDAVLCASGMQYLFTDLGYRIPDDFAIALLGHLGDYPGYAGMDEQCFRTGVAAVDSVVGMIHRGERGVPEQPYRLLIEGRWVDGPSAPPVGSGGVITGRETIEPGSV